MRQTETMIRAAGELRKEQILGLARPPWAPAQLRTYLPVTPSQTLGLAEAESHAHVNMLAVRPRGLCDRACSASARRFYTAKSVLTLLLFTCACDLCSRAGLLVCLHTKLCNRAEPPTKRQYSGAHSKPGVEVMTVFKFGAPKASPFTCCVLNWGVAAARQAEACVPDVI